MKYAETKLTPWLLLGLLLALSCYDVARATTTISSGHVDIFEAEYENDGTNAPTVHLGVHADTHYEPGEVLLEVGNAAYRSTVGLQVDIRTFLGPNAWVLPDNLEEAGELGVLEAGVGKYGFPPLSPVTFTMVSAGAENPGKFVLFSDAETSFTRLRAVGGSIEVGSFSISTGHIHYNWGFSAPGTYTFDLKASYEDADFGVLESAVETYTFNVIPEPSSGALLLFGLAGWVTARKRVLSKG